MLLLPPSGGQLRDQARVGVAFEVAELHEELIHPQQRVFKVSLFSFLPSVEETVGGSFVDIKFGGDAGRLHVIAKLLRRRDRNELVLGSEKGDGGGVIFGGIVGWGDGGEPWFDPPWCGGRGRVGEGKSGDFGGARIIKKKNKEEKKMNDETR